MAEGEDVLEVRKANQSAPFLEVLCKSSGKIRRFAAGTEVRFAVDLINKKLLSESVAGNGLLATHIEAIKDAEEPVSFGPTSCLVHYGSGWQLQTVVESHADGEAHTGRMGSRRKSTQGGEFSPFPVPEKSLFSLVYVMKIVLAFVLMFVFGAVFILALEYLPLFISFISTI